jgi:serine/threonine protein kinase
VRRTGRFMTFPTQDVDERDPLSIIGRAFGRYEIVDYAGSGGFSYVYRAIHTLWNEPVAMKFFHGLLTAPDNLRERLLDGFIREGKLMSTLSTRSAAIVQARDVGRYAVGDKWIPYMVLEWVHGEPLDEVLEWEASGGHAPRSLGQILEFLQPAAEALFVAHDADVAHRDLKPGNIMIRTGDEGLKVLDFGIAKVMEEGDQETRQTETGLGLNAFTPAYGAPEQFSKEHGATGPWTDVFAMALIIVELMRNEPVLCGDLLHVARVSCDPSCRPTPRTLGLDVSDAVEAVFARALAVEVADRHVNMRTFWTELVFAVTGVRSVSSWNLLTPSSSLRSAAMTLDTHTIQITESEPAAPSDPEPSIGSSPDGSAPVWVMEPAEVIEEPTLMSRRPDAAIAAADARKRATPKQAAPDDDDVSDHPAAPPTPRRWRTLGVAAAAVMAVGAAFAFVNRSPQAPPNQVPNAADKVDEVMRPSVEVTPTARNDEASSLNPVPDDVPSATVATVTPIALASARRPSPKAVPAIKPLAPIAAAPTPAGSTTPAPPAATPPGPTESPVDEKPDPFDPDNFGSQH